MANMPGAQPTADDVAVVNFEIFGYWTQYHHSGNHNWGANPTVTYAFDPASGFTANEQAAFAEGLQLWSDVANIHFTVTANFASAGIQISRGNDGQANTVDSYLTHQPTQLLNAATSID